MTTKNTKNALPSRGLKISEENAAKIEAALDAANGVATTHTYTTAKEIFDVVSRVEKKLARLSLLKKDWLGIRAYAFSGESVFKAYDYSRIATRIEVERRPSGWFLVGVRRWEIWKESPDDQIWLSPAQRDLSVAAHCKKFHVDGESKKGWHCI